MTGSEIPKVVVPKASLLEHNSNITLACNITDRGNRFATPLKKIYWMKDGVVLYMYNFTSAVIVPVSFPFVLQELRESDDGNYTCVLEVLLRNVKKYIVTDYTLIKVKGL